MKPIAYIDHVSGKPKLIDAYVVQTPVDIPLYTHPVELTDKEINPLWRYRKKGEFDQFSYVEWNDEDSFGYEITMFLPTY